MIKELDLHGVRHSEVDCKVENFILLEEKPIRIITGNSDEMRRLVINVLERHRMNYWSFKPGQLTILK
tara:strand:+ start:277 stop:480 length:204 start_codon:yes stop_codon:yes gene_type:complete